ncbi:MAG: phosphodiester glycosidase family protein [Oscillospiraceae bacterium]|jgi:exopolysaccharide biosynthesis protein|nr:phosphodiester glycosidase family protein [Oscillospiraceae bacterium]
MRKILFRIGICLLTAVALTVFAVYATLYNVANGKSPAMRNLLVNAAMQASATKWIPGLVLPGDTISEILDASDRIDYVDIADLRPAETATPPDETEVILDPWDSAVDGMLLETYIAADFKAYVLLVKDPSRVYTARCRSRFSAGARGDTVFTLVENEGAVAAINGGGFYDDHGKGGGGLPLGLTYSGGECVHSDGYRLTFIGFDNNNRLVAENNMTRDRADELGVRDGVSFKKNNALINSVDGKIVAAYADEDTAPSQRTAIGQTADGTVILMVTDGRTADSLGASRNDIINAMLSYGAVTAGMLDGGSSAVMCYPGYYDKYSMDTSLFSQYQLQGLVNKYHAFTSPRTIPTFFAVKPEQAQG